MRFARRSMSSYGVDDAVAPSAVFSTSIERLLVLVVLVVDAPRRGVVRVRASVAVFRASSIAAVVVVVGAIALRTRSSILCSFVRVVESRSRRFFASLGVTRNSIRSHTPTRRRRERRAHPSDRRRGDRSFSRARDRRFVSFRFVSFRFVRLRVSRRSFVSSSAGDARR